MQAKELIAIGLALRDELKRLKAAHPDEYQLSRPLLVQGFTSAHIPPQESELELKRWRSSIYELMEESRQFFNYHQIFERFAGLMQVPENTTGVNQSGTELLHMHMRAKAMFSSVLRRH